MKNATVAQITDEVVRFQKEIGPSFRVSPNGYGVHVKCESCSEFATQDRAYRFPRIHVCAA